MSISVSSLPIRDAFTRGKYILHPKLVDVTAVDVPINEIVDMGQLEQQQVAQTLRNALGGATVKRTLQAVFDKFGVDIRPQPVVFSSRPLSMLDSSFRVDDVLGKNEDLLRSEEGRSEAETRHNKIHAGLRHFLGSGIAAHVAPRDTTDDEQEQGNLIGYEYFAILKNGEIVSSVGTASLSAVKDKIVKLVKVNHAFVAARVAAAKGDKTDLVKDAESRINTQYTACYVRPYMEVELLRHRAETLLRYGTKALRKLLTTTEGRIDLADQALTSYIASLEQVRHLVEKHQPDAAKLPIFEKAEKGEIDDVPPNILTKTDEYGIPNFTMRAEEWESLKGGKPNRQIYITLQTRRDGPVTRTATIKPGSFNGKIYELVLAPSAHEDHAGGNNGSGRVEVNLFRRMNGNGFVYGEAPCGFFGNNGPFDDNLVSGAKILSVVPVDVVEHHKNLLNGLGIHHAGWDDPKNVLAELRKEGLVQGTDYSQLEATNKGLEQMKRYAALPQRSSLTNGALTHHLAGQDLNQPAPTG
jgi:hypothetical protein